MKIFYVKIIVFLIVISLCACTKATPTDRNEAIEMLNINGQLDADSLEDSPHQSEPDSANDSEAELINSDDFDGIVILDEPLLTVTGFVTVAFEYKKQTGSASNQFAVWIVDSDGHMVKTLYATRYTANGGYLVRPDSIALWVEMSELESMPKFDVDAITGATPLGGKLSYVWDLTDTNGETVSPGIYTVYVEGTLRWKNYVIYTASIDINGVSSITIADAEFHYEASGIYSSLNNESIENEMIGSVIVNYMTDN
ncbi:MAG: DUF2271 domain-containing protein [Oscillospiraceae bacterium]|nr:DUF2271 domain-containing protein [Oscillospiraceae bacterium]